MMMRRELVSDPGLVAGELRAAASWLSGVVNSFEAGSEDPTAAREAALEALTGLTELEERLRTARTGLVDLAVRRGTGAAELGRALRISRQAAHRMHVVPRRNGSRP